MANPFVLKGIRICAEDVAFLSALGSFGHIDTQAAGEWYPNHKPNSVQKRLRLLADNGLIHQSRLLVGFESKQNKGKGGRLPTLHSLNDAGADLVQSVTGERPKRTLRSRPTAGTFLHRRDVSRVMQTFTRSCASAGLDLPDWILEQDPWPGAPKKLPPNQRVLLYHRIALPNRVVICQPDAAARLKLPTAEVALFFEVDRSTEGHKQIEASSRLDAYVELIKRRDYQRYWPDLETRHHYVMWVCRSQQRIDNLKETLGDHPIASVTRFALFSHFEHASDVIASSIWQTTTSDFRSIYAKSNADDST